MLFANVSSEKNHIYIEKSGVNLADTLECGQCFRWNKYGDIFVGTVNDKICRAEQKNDKIILSYTGIENDCEFWIDYFDLKTDYSAILKSIRKGTYAYEASKACSGIHILKQDKWETLVSFIISANNNITRIKKIIEMISEKWGTKLEDCGFSSNGFPTPETMSKITIEDLSSLHVGYRDKYLEAVFHDNMIESKINGFEKLNDENLKKELLKIKGVGPKVCACVMLFGYSRYAAFPEDVWIKRVKAEHPDDNYSTESLGKYAGVIQQYLFHYSRNIKGN